MALKTAAEIRLMRKAGLLLWHAHQVATSLAKAGRTTRQIDAAVDRFIADNGATAMFKGVPGAFPYPAATCISVNEEVVHGIPSERVLREGDLVGIDIGVRLNGWCADSAVTHRIGRVSRNAERLATVTEESLRMAIHLLNTCTKWRDVTIQTSAFIHAAGFSIVEDLTGHAIGRAMWENPVVPNHVDRTLPDFRIRTGLVLAIEPMINMGAKDVVTRDDQWTVATRDGKPSAHYEHTVAIADNGPIVLTCGPDGEGWAMP